MKKILLFLLISLTVLTGCSKEEECSYDGLLDFYNIPIVDNIYIEVPKPKNAYLVNTDGLSFWRLSDDTSIELYMSDSTLNVKLSDNVYISDESVEYIIDGYSIVVRGCESYLQDVKEYWLNNDPCKCHEAMWALDRYSTVLPNYTLRDGVMSSHGVVLPSYMKTIGDTAYSADVWSDESDYMFAYVRYAFIYSIRESVYARMCIYGSSDFNWYETDDYLFAWNDQHCVAALKETENKYIIFGSSYNMMDYVLCNINKLY